MVIPMFPTSDTDNVSITNKIDNETSNLLTLKEMQSCKDRYNKDFNLDIFEIYGRKIRSKFSNETNMLLDYLKDNENNENKGNLAELRISINKLQKNYVELMGQEYLKEYNIDLNLDSKDPQKNNLFQKSIVILLKTQRDEIDRKFSDLVYNTRNAKIDFYNVDLINQRIKEFDLEIQINAVKIILTSRDDCAKLYNAMKENNSNAKLIQSLKIDSDFKAKYDHLYKEMKDQLDFIDNFIKENNICEIAKKVIPEPVEVVAEVVAPCNLLTSTSSTRRLQRIRLHILKKKKKNKKKKQID